MSACIVCVGFPGTSKICFCCKIHLCKSVASKTENANICVPCLKLGSEKNILHKDNKGRFIDPVSQKPMTTCICGSAMWDLCPCMAKILNNDKNHRVIY